MSSNYQVKGNIDKSINLRFALSSTGRERQHDYVIIYPTIVNPITLGPGTGVFALKVPGIRDLTKFG